MEQYVKGRRAREEIENYAENCNTSGRKMSLEPEKDEKKLIEIPARRYLSKIRLRCIDIFCILTDRKRTNARNVSVRDCNTIKKNSRQEDTLALRFHVVYEL